MRSGGAGVVRPAVHHHLADDGADAVRLGRPERRVERGLVDRAVDQRGRRPGGGEGPVRRGCEALGRVLVEGALQREDVPLEPVEQVQPGPDAGVRQLRQVDVGVDSRA